jgi:hypothetical protein
MMNSYYASATTGITNTETTFNIDGQDPLTMKRGSSAVKFVASGSVSLVTDPNTNSISFSVAPSDIFKTVSVSGQQDVVADSSTDGLTLTAGPNIAITSDAAQDTITITGDISYANNNYLLVGYDSAGSPTDDLGIVFKRPSVNNQALVWDESEDEFAFITTSSDHSTSGSAAIISYSQVKAASYITPSSRRLKKNIVEIDEPMDKLKKLRGVYFDWKESGKRDMGFIAEEVGKIIPEIVSYEDEENASGIDYARLTSLLLESVKEQQVIIDKQEKKINFLYKFLNLTKPTKT